MVQLSDRSDAASKVRDEQAARLTRLRERLGLTVTDAAKMAGVSRFAWARMERAESNLDAVALARFVNAAKLPAEYVVTGRHDGLPPGLVRELVQVEVLDQAAREGDAARTPPPAGPAPRGRKRQTRTPRNANEATPATPAVGSSDSV